jgi:hypothetical protein
MPAQGSEGEWGPRQYERVKITSKRLMIEDLIKLGKLPNYDGDYIAFRMDGKWGLAARTDGRIVIGALFDAPFRFSEGLAGVQLSGKYGFIDESGAWVIKPKFDVNYTWSFIGDVCAVEIDGRAAIIDRKGNYIWSPGLVRAENLGGGIFIQTSDGLSGFLDDNGKLIPSGGPNTKYMNQPSRK